MVGEDADDDGYIKGKFQIPNVWKKFWIFLSWPSSCSTPTSPTPCNYANIPSSFLLPFIFDIMLLDKIPM